jgi:glyoxalase family protein
MAYCHDVTAKKEPAMQPIQSQGVHHITISGADRATSIDFWRGVLGMPFVFEQPNLDNPNENHLYFDPGDGRLITIFTDETRQPDTHKLPQTTGHVHHIAFHLSRSSFTAAQANLKARGITAFGPKDRGFMDSLYFRDPLGLLIELATWRFEPPAGFTHTDVLARAHRLRVASGDHNITDSNLAAAITALIAEANTNNDLGPS